MKKSTINQVQASGAIQVFEASSVNFGLGLTDSQNRSTFSNVQNNTWSGATKASDYPASLFQANNLGDYFNKIPGGNMAGAYNTLYTFDFAAVRDATAKAVGNQAAYLPNFATADTDRLLKEKSTSAYTSFNTDWDTAIPFHSSIGVRLEKTEVTSVAQVMPATALVWVSQNELPVTFAGTSMSTTTASYTNVLPSINLDFDIRTDMKLRASAGETIGRPRYDQLQGGLTLGTIANTYNAHRVHRATPR